MTIEGWFEKEDRRGRVQPLHAQFGSEDSLIVTSQGRDVFSPASLEAVRGIQEEVQLPRPPQEGENRAQAHRQGRHPGERSVLTVDGDVLASRRLSATRCPLARSDRRIKAIAEAEKQRPIQFFSRDTSTADYTKPIRRHPGRRGADHRGNGSLALDQTSRRTRKSGRVQAHDSRLPEAVRGDQEISQARVRQAVRLLRCRHTAAANTT